MISGDLGQKQKKEHCCNCGGALFAAVRMGQIFLCGKRLHLFVSHS